MEKSLLGSEKLPRLMLRLALPSILAQLINILYNIVDRIYIGHIENASSLALTGLGICSPVIIVVSAFSLFAGSGGAPLVSIELGKSEYDKNALRTAESILGNAFILLAVFAVILSIVLGFFRIPILTAFGASSATLPYASDYLAIYLCGTFFVFLSMGLNPFITCQGHARTAMISTLIGAVLNIILDPIFIFIFDLGVKGAAFATIISQGVSALWILIFLSSAKSAVRLRPAIIRFNASIMKKIASLGISPFIMTSTESAIFVVFNSSLQKYGGDIYVATLTILQSMMQMVFVPVQGFAEGVQSIISYNFGAKKIDRVKKTIFSMTAIVFAVLTLFSILIHIFVRQVTGIFTDDQELIVLVCKMLPVYFGGVWVFGIQVGAQRSFVALGKAKTSVFIALLRKAILLIPLALILPKYMGVSGIFWAEPIASTISALTCLVLLIGMYKKL